MKNFVKKWEKLLEWGGVKKDIALLVVSGIAVLGSLLKVRLFLLIWRGSPSSFAGSPF